MPAPLLALALLLAGPPRSNVNWGEEHSSFTSGPQYAGTKGVCRKLGEPKPPAADRPTPAQARALKGCDSEKLYYGEGKKPDYERARQCALIERDTTDDSEVFGGSTILMQVYANGLGVKKDLDLATAYACDIEGAPAEVDGRVSHLQALKTKPTSQGGGGRVDYCDDITSGLAQGFCQNRMSTKLAVGRDARLRAVAAKLPPAARPLYPPMKRAFDAFVDAHGGGEVDLSGTGRAAFEIEEEDATRDAFLKDLNALLAGRWPAASAAQARVADADLNAAYRKALAATAKNPGGGEPQPDGVRKAQRAWLPYREVFVRFARAAAPGTSPEAVLVHLARARIDQLDALVD